MVQFTFLVVCFYIITFLCLMVIDPYPTYDTQQKTSQASIRAIYEMSQLWPIYSLTANFIRIPGVSLQKGRSTGHQKEACILHVVLIESETIANVIFRLPLNHWYFKFHWFSTTICPLLLIFYSAFKNNVKGPWLVMIFKFDSKTHKIHFLNKVCFRLFVRYFEFNT